MDGGVIARPPDHPTARPQARYCLLGQLLVRITFDFSSSSRRLFGAIAGVHLHFPLALRRPEASVARASSKFPSRATASGLVGGGIRAMPSPYKQREGRADAGAEFARRQSFSPLAFGKPKFRVRAGLVHAHMRYRSGPNPKSANSRRGRAPLFPQRQEPPRVTLDVQGGVERAPCALDRPEYANLPFTLTDVAFDDLRGLAAGGASPGLCEPDRPVAAGRQDLRDPRPRGAASSTTPAMSPPSRCRNNASPTAASASRW